MKYSELLLKKGKKIGVWGTGYIGFSSMIFFARKGVHCIGYDVIPKKVDDINKGKYIFKEMENWLRFPIKPLLKKGYITGTTDFKRLLADDIIVHLIAIPTEKNGEPYYDNLKDVIAKLGHLSKRKSAVKPLIIVESTLTPKSSEKIVLPLLRKSGLEIGRDILYGVAPRRDWFVSGGKNLEELDRVFGGADEESAAQMESVLGIVCKKLHRASNHQVSEMVKSFENAYRHMDITLANQLSLGYPNDDIREVLRLVGTKWNIGTFYPGFGTGGYCIPLSSKYVLQGAERPGEIDILSSTIRTDTQINNLIARSLIRRGYKKIGVLGLSYKENLKVNILSPTIPFVNELKQNRIEVKAYDPYYSREEIRKYLGVGSFAFPEGLKEFDAIVLTVAHDAYCRISKNRLINHLKKGAFVLDNTGRWKDRLEDNNRSISYVACGQKGWLI